MFHDDQHGTAITVAAAVRNGLLVQGKDLSDVKLVTSGAGAAALACVDLLVSMGLRPENVTLTDIKGVVTTTVPTCCPTWPATPAKPTPPPCRTRCRVRHLHGLVRARAC